jgi:hypothetical protein
METRLANSIDNIIYIYLYLYKLYTYNIHIIFNITHLYNIYICFY